MMILKLFLEQSFFFFFFKRADVRGRTYFRIFAKIEGRRIFILPYYSVENGQLLLTSIDM